MALPKKNRIVGKKEIEHIFKNGKTIRSSFLFIRFLNNQRGYSRFTFVVPAKYTPLAVDRNKIKRIFSGEVTKTSFLLGRDYDVIVVISRKITREKFKDLTKELRGVLSKMQS